MLIPVYLSSREIISCRECGQNFDTIDALREHERSEEDKELQNKGLWSYRWEVTCTDMVRGLLFSFPVYIGTMSCLAILAVGIDNDLFSLVYTEVQQEHLIHFISSSLDDNGGQDLYHGSAFIEELENIIKNFEYTFDLEGN